MVRFDAVIASHFVNPVAVSVAIIIVEFILRNILLQSEETSLVSLEIVGEFCRKCFQNLPDYGRRGDFCTAVNCLFTLESATFRSAVIKMVRLLCVVPSKKCPVSCTGLKLEMFDGNVNTCKYCTVWFCAVKTGFVFQLAVWGTACF